MSSIDGNMFSNGYDIVASIQEELAREMPTLSQLQEELKKELKDPEISLLHNIQHLSVAELDSFDFHSGMFEISEGREERAPPSPKKKW